MRAHPDIDIDVDLSFLSKESKTLALKFIELSKPKRKSLRARFPNTNEALLGILEEMLEINPEANTFRWRGRRRMLSTPRFSPIFC